MFIDVHCHLTGGEYEGVGGTEAVLVRAREAGVKAFVVSGFDLPSSLAAAELAARYKDVYFCAGYQPEELKKYREGDLDEIAALAREEKCVAVGEIGIDRHFPDNPPVELQRELFVRQIALADDAGLPIVVHSRDGAAETLDILRANAAKQKRGGLMHCYSYSAEMTGAFAALGMYFSFGGTSTFRNAKKVQESARRVPSDRILSETDSPYLTPVPFRGVFPNEPGNVVHVVRNLAALRNEKEEELEGRIFSNAERLFFRLADRRI